MACNKAEVVGVRKAASRMMYRLATTVCGIAVLVAVVLGCDCTPPSSVLAGYYEGTSPVIKADLVGILGEDELYVYYEFSYNFVFRGCSPSAHEFIVKSSKSDCGVRFTEGVKYMLTLNEAGGATPPPGVAARGLDMYSARSCDFNVEWQSLPFEHINELYYSEARGCDV